jgi:hypothetical protein
MGKIISKELVFILGSASSKIDHYPNDEELQKISDDLFKANKKFNINK